MSAGISRLHGTAETGASVNVTGAKSMFFSGYQPLFVKVVCATAKFPVATGYTGVNSLFEQTIRAAESVGTVVAYGVPAAVGSDDVFIIAFDNASLNQGSGAGGQSGATTGFGLLKDILEDVAAANSASAVAGDFTLTAYTGFSGGSLAA
jgi:threonine dehydrogenase-like Zn-dependent dehydrogenase